MPKPDDRSRDLAYLLALSVVWGAAFALIKIAVADIPPITLAAGRITVAALLLLAIQAVSGPPLRDLLRRPLWRSWWPFLVLGMLGHGFPAALIGAGETRIDSGLAALLIGTMPIFTLLLAHAFKVERRLGPRAWCAIALGFAGLVVLLGPNAGAGLAQGDESDILAQVAVILAAVSYAATAIFGRLLSLTLPLPLIASASTLASATMLVPAALVFDRPWQLSPSLDAVAAVLALGVFSTALAAILYFRLLRSAGPTFVALANYLMPAFGFVLGVVWLDESFGSREVLALTLILAAVALTRRAP